jgi:hypothetical protein
MKPYTIMLMTVVLFATDVFSQFTPTTTTLSTPRGDVKIQDLRYTGPYNMYMVKLSIKKPFNLKNKYEIRALLQNDSVIIDAGKLHKDGNTYIITYDSLKIKSTETKEIIFPIEEGEFLKGIPKDTCWIFKTASGTINAYAVTPNIDTKDIVAIQKLTGEIVPFSKELLIEWLKLDPKAVKLAEKDKYLDAIKLYNQ